jgi:peptidoglycan/LPS O-acetylase OafA/YrhL
MGKDIFKYNSYDLVRLIAALQVALSHATVHLKVEGGFLTEIIRLFPGVPIFFFVSGFLISKSFENASSYKQYANNRLLRIYPALVVCTLLSLLSVYLTGYYKNTNTNILHLVAWVAGQISVVQFYNPEFMRGFGTGVLNGSLWTITVELQFYILVPILYWALGEDKNNKYRQNIILITAIVLFMTCNIMHTILLPKYNNYLFYKLWSVSFTPWFYMFLVGVYFQKHFEHMYCLLHGRFVFIILAYITACFFTVKFLKMGLGNTIHPLLYIILVSVIFSFAYSFSTLSDYLLKKNDISYGVYIYHVPVINIFMYYGYVSRALFVFLVLVLSFVAASISWYFIERPAIKLKKNTINSLQSVNKCIQRNI